MHTKNKADAAALESNATSSEELRHVTASLFDKKQIPDTVAAHAVGNFEVAFLSASTSQGKLDATVEERSQDGPSDGLAHGEAADINYYTLFDTLFVTPNGIMRNIDTIFSEKPVDNGVCESPCGRRRRCSIGDFEDYHKQEPKSPKRIKH